jgi:hypothetical protein
MKDKVAIINKSHLTFSKLDDDKKSNVLEAVKRLDNVSNPKIKHEINGIAKSKLIEERTHELEVCLRENGCEVTQQGFDLIIENIKLTGNQGVKEGRLFMFTTEQHEILEQVKLADKNWIQSEEGNEYEKKVLQNHVNYGRVHNRRHEFGFDNGKMLVASRYDMISDADDVMEDIKASLVAKNAQELLEASEQLHDEVDMTKLTKSQLKVELKAKGLKVSGNKSLLQARLSKHMTDELLGKVQDRNSNT